MDAPSVRYAKAPDGVHVAYQVAGDGPTDLVIISSAIGLGNPELWTDERPFPHRYTGFSRLILLDRRGTGLSDHIVSEQQLTLEAQIEDVRAVLDAVGARRPVLLGFESGFGVAALFAATYPERAAALIAYGAQARDLWAPDYPIGRSRASSDAELDEVERGWATLDVAQRWVAALDPDSSDDLREISSFVESMKSIGGPGDAARWFEVDRELDLRPILPMIGVPTLVLHRTEDQAVPVEHARYLAAHIPGAELRELPGDTHMWDKGEDLPREVERFLTTLREEEFELDRYLGTVLFTDIVGSTSVASSSGDAAWRDLVERHHHLVRGALARFRGKEMDTAGDGFFAVFDGPARAIRCALAIVAAVPELGIEVRAGVHTGELQEIDGKAGGIAVVIGARIMAAAEPATVLVSQTVKDLVAGSGLAFEDAGDHELKGVPDRWRLYRVVN